MVKYKTTTLDRPTRYTVEHTHFVLILVSNFI